MILDGIYHDDRVRGIANGLTFGRYLLDVLTVEECEQIEFL